MDLEDSLRKIVASRLRAWREMSGLSQGDVADRTGIHVNTVSNWERGSALPNIKGLIALASLMEMEPWQLIHPGESEPRVIHSARLALMLLDEASDRIDLTRDRLREIFDVKSSETPEFSEKFLQTRSKGYISEDSERSGTQSIEIDDGPA